MDNILLNSRFAKMIMSKIIVHAIKKTYGIEADIRLDNLAIRHADGGDVEVSIGVSAKMKEEVLSDVIDTIM